MFLRARMFCMYLCHSIITPYVDFQSTNYLRGDHILHCFVRTTSMYSGCTLGTLDVPWVSNRVCPTQHNDQDWQPGTLEYVLTKNTVTCTVVSTEYAQQFDSTLQYLRVRQPKTYCQYGYTQYVDNGISSTRCSTCWVRSSRRLSPRLRVHHVQDTEYGLISHSQFTMPNYRCGAVLL